MKLIYAAGSKIPSNTANSVHVMRMCEALAGHGHDVTLLAKQGDAAVGDVFGHYGIRVRFGIETVPFANRSGLLGYLRRLDGLLDADLIIGRYLYPLVLAQVRGRRTVYESHVLPTGRQRLLERWYFSRPGVLRHVVITEALKRRYDATGLPEPVAGRVVIPDAAVDPGPSAGTGEQENLVIGYAGGWYAGRGIELIADLATRFPQHRFRIAGGDAAGLGRLGLQVTSNMSCAGYLPHGQVAEFLKPCDILVAPYRCRVSAYGDAGDISEFFSPMKLFEYMALGKAIVCSDLPVLHEILDETTGVLVDAGDVEAWVRALERLDADRDELRRLGHAARERFVARHTWEQRSRRLLAGL